MTYYELFYVGSANLVTEYDSLDDALADAAYSIEHYGEDEVKHWMLGEGYPSTAKIFEGEDIIRMVRDARKII